MIAKNQEKSLTLDQVSLVSSLFENYRKKVFLYLYGFTRDRDIANDLVGEVFEKVIKAVRDGVYTDEDKPAHWLNRIAHNVFIDHTRKLKKLLL